MLIRLFTAMILLFVGWPASAYSEPNMVEYELQERCGKRASEVFKSEYTTVKNTEEGQILFNYRNHYSAAFNKCFFLETSTVLATRVKSRYTAEMLRLYDINDNKEYGSFYQRSDSNMPMDCVVVGRSCRSKAEWESLIKPYMGEQ